jgi:hypothetical protein
MMLVFVGIVVRTAVWVIAIGVWGVLRVSCMMLVFVGIVVRTAVWVIAIGVWHMLQVSCMMLVFVDLVSRFLSALRTLAMLYWKTIFY